MPDKRLTDGEWNKLNTERLALIAKGPNGLTKAEESRLDFLEKRADSYLKSLPGFDRLLADRLRRMFQHHKKARR